MLAVSTTMSWLLLKNGVDSLCVHTFWWLKKNYILLFYTHIVKYCFVCWRQNLVKYCYYMLFVCPIKFLVTVKHFSKRCLSILVIILFQCKKMSVRILDKWNQNRWNASCKRIFSEFGWTDLKPTELRIQKQIFSRGSRDVHVIRDQKLWLTGHIYCLGKQRT